MPIAFDTAKRITGQFSVLPFFNTWNETALGHITDTIASASRDENFAMRLARMWIRSSKDLPTPFELLQLADSLREGDVSTMPQQDFGCDKCGGSGYESFWELQTTEFWPNGAVKFRRSECISTDMGVRPEVEGQVDGIAQRVGQTARLCTCSQGRRIEEAKLRQQAINHDAAQKTGGKRGGGMSKASAGHWQEKD